MCRQIIRDHTVCNHITHFLIIECPNFGLKRTLHEERSFWSKLFRPKPSCKVKKQREMRDSFCDWCTRQRPQEDYPSDNYGLGRVPCDYNTNVTTKGRFRKEISSSDSKRQDLTMPEIQNNMVNPGIDMDRWDHVIPHMIPPRPGPPPDKPLPPTPTESQSGNAQSRQAPVPQGRQRNASGHSIPRKAVAGQRHKDGHTRSNHQVAGPSGPISPVQRPRLRRREPPLQLVPDGDRGFPGIAFLPEPDLGRPLTFSFLQNDELRGQEPQDSATRVGRNYDGTSQWREKPGKFQYSPVSPLTPKTNSPTMHPVDGPNRRAQTTDGRYEHVHSMYGDIAYVSPRLEQRIDDVEESWTASARQSEERNDLRIRAETEPVQQQGVKGKSKAGRRIQFDEVVRGDTRYE